MRAMGMESRDDRQISQTRDEGRPIHIFVSFSLLHKIFHLKCIERFDLKVKTISFRSLPFR